MYPPYTLAQRLVPFYWVKQGECILGDDEITVITPPASEPPPVAVIDPWRAEHEARHAEHIAHLETIREEHRSEVQAIRDKVTELEGIVIGLASAPPPESPDKAALDQALDTVESVGEVIANVTEAINPEEPVEAPPSPPSHHEPAGPVGEVTPDVGEGSGTNAPPHSKRRSRFW